MTAVAGPAVTVVVLTKDEERNLPACLESVTGWAPEVFIVDSGSTDGTVAVAAAYGATVVTHPFTSHAAQWRWALESLPITNEWVLGLDADQRVSPALRASLTAALAGDDGSVAGYFVPRRQVFRGRWIRYGGYYPKYLLKLFRRRAVRLDERDLVDHHFIVDGPTRRLAGDLVEDNLNEAEMSVWIAKHTRYARLQAAEELERMARGDTAGKWLGNPDQRTARLKRVWWALPLYVRPFLYFFYRYFLRLGFLDGKQGLIFHFMQGLWYRLLVDINIDDLAAQAEANHVSARSSGHR